MLWMKRVMTTLITLIAMVRRVVAVGLLGCLMLAFVPVGCGSQLGPITATHAQSDGHPPVPRATVERLKACMEHYGEQLAPGSHSIHLVIKTDKNGVKRRVTENEIPNTAPEFASCVRQALREMEIPAEFFRLAADMEKNTQGDVSKAQRSNMGSPFIVVGVAIGLSGLVLEAGAYTILFAISVELLNEAAEDIADVLRRRPGWQNDCDLQRTECLMSDIADQPGGLFKHTLCHMCREFYVKSKGQWPSEIEKFDGTMASCAYWRHTGN